MLKYGLIQELQVTEKFFFQTISPLGPGDATFRAKPEMYSVAGHIYHVGDTVRWFMEGPFSGWMVLI